MFSNSQNNFNTSSSFTGSQGWKKKSQKSKNKKVFGNHGNYIKELNKSQPYGLNQKFKKSISKFRSCSTQKFKPYTHNTQNLVMKQNQIFDPFPNQYLVENETQNVNQLYQDNNYLEEKTEKYYKKKKKVKRKAFDKTRFYNACKSGNLNIVKSMIGKDFDPNFCFFFGYKEKHTPLFAACEKKRTEVVRVLLSHPRIDPNKTSGFGKKSPLFLATELRSVEIVRELLKHDNINPNYQNPFHYAFIKQFPEIVVEFLKHKMVDPNCRDISIKKNPLFLSCKNNSLPFVRAILIHPLVNPNYPDVASFYCIQKKFYNIWREFFRHPSYIPTREILIFVCKNKGKTDELMEIFNDIMEKYYYHFSKIDYEKILEISCKQSDLRSVRKILDLAKEFLINIDASLFISCKKKMINIFVELIRFQKYGNDPNIFDVISNRTLLLISCENEQKKFVNELLKHPKINPNIGSNSVGNSKTPIFVCCEKRLEDYVDLLLNNEKINPNISSWFLGESFTPLRFCSRKGYLKIVKLLINHPKISNEEISRSLVTSILYKEKLISIELLKYPKLDPNKGNPPPLYHALSIGNSVIAKMLIKHPKSNPIGDGFRSFLLSCEKGSGIFLNILRRYEIPSQILGKCFFFSCSSGYLEFVKNILLIRDKKVNLNLKIMGKTSLQKAVENKMDSIVELLFSDTRIDVNIGNLFVLFCRMGKTNFVKILLNHPNFIRTRGNVIGDGLIESVNYCNLDISRLLIKERGIKFLDVENSLHKAFSYVKSNLKYLSFILEVVGLFREINVNVPYILYYFCAYFKVSEVRCLLKHPKIDPNFAKINCSPIGIATKRGCVEIVKELLEHPKINPNQNESGRSPLSIASSNGNFCIIKDLLNHPRIDINDNNPVYFALDSGNINLAKELMKHHKFDPSAEKYITLLFSCRKGFREIVQLFLKKSIPLNVVESCFFISCQEGHDGIVDDLLKNFRKLNVCNSYFLK